MPVPPLVLASLGGTSSSAEVPGEEEEEGRWSEASSGPACRVRWEAAAGHGGQGWGCGGAALRKGWDGLFFLLLSLPRRGSLADFLDQLLIGQAVEAVDGQVRDEVLTGFAGDLFATSQVNEGDVGDAAQVEQGLVRQLIAACHVELGEGVACGRAHGREEIGRLVRKVVAVAEVEAGEQGHVADDQPQRGIRDVQPGEPEINHVPELAAIVLTGFVCWRRE